MYAAVIESFDQPPRYQSFPEPAPNADEVLVHVRAAALSNLARSIAYGSHYSAGGELPAVAGVDGVGTLAGGSRVYFIQVRKPWGTMAERAAASRSRSIPIPDGLDDVQAAAIANPGMSVWLPLVDRANLVAGETVLIMGATGVAGHLAIQVARRLGAGRILAAGRNVDSLAEADVDVIIALGQPDDAIREALAAEAAKGIHVVVDYVWGRPTELLIEALTAKYSANATNRTRLVEVGEMAGKTINLPGGALRSIDLTISGSGLGSMPPNRILHAISEIFSLAAAGKAHVDVDAVPLSEIASAWNRAEKARRTVFTI